MLSCLIRLRDDVTELGGTIVLAAPQPMVKRLLAIAGPAPMFEIHATVAEVREKYGLEGATRRIEVVADVID